MKQALTLILILYAGIMSAQSNSFVTDRLRAAEYFRIGNGTSQKITGFARVIYGNGTNDSLTTSKAVVDYVQDNFAPLGYYEAGEGIDISGNIITNSLPDLSIDIQGGPGITIFNSYPDISISVEDVSATNELQTISISGQNLTLSNGGGTVAIPGGSSLGTGFTAGGGSGTIPNGTIAQIESGGLGQFQMQYTNGAPFLRVDEDGLAGMQLSSINGEASVLFDNSGFYFNNVAPTGAISFSVQDSGIKVTDGTTAAKGIEYTDRYPAIKTNARSIPDVGLVKELITDSLSTISSDALGTGFVDGGGTGSIPAGTNAQLVDGLNIKYSNGVTALGIGSTTGAISFVDKDEVSQMGFSPDGFYLSGDGGALEFVTGIGLSFRDDINAGGIKYADDYSPGFTARSLVDKAYVDGSSGSALGTGFTDGGGSGIIPTGTIATTETFGTFQINYATTNTPAIIVSDDEGNISLYSPDGSASFTFDGTEALMRAEFSSLHSTGASAVLAAPDGIHFTNNSNGLGAVYDADYSPTLKANARSIPDVGTVNIIKQDLVSYTTTQRNAISSPAAGRTIYCSDCTATDSSTGVQQVYNGSTWKNAW